MRKHAKYNKYHMVIKYDTDSISLTRKNFRLSQNNRIIQNREPRIDHPEDQLRIYIKLFVTSVILPYGEINTSLSQMRGAAFSTASLIVIHAKSSSPLNNNHATRKPRINPINVPYFLIILHLKTSFAFIFIVM